MCASRSFLPLQKLLDEGSDDFHKAVRIAISCINDHNKYYEKVRFKKKNKLFILETNLTNLKGLISNVKDYFKK
jgi:ribosomal protein L30/L7E